MTLQTRTLHSACCPKCLGTGRRIDYSRELGEGCTVPCDHTARVDVTGPDDDQVRIAELEDEVARLRRRVAELEGR